MIGFHPLFVWFMALLFLALMGCLFLGTQITSMPKGLYVLGAIAAIAFIIFTLRLWAEGQL